MFLCICGMVELFLRHRIIRKCSFGNLVTALTLALSVAVIGECFVVNMGVHFTLVHDNLFSYLLERLLNGTPSSIFDRFMTHIFLLDK